ncbi:MAG: Sir2 family NAD-dependent protein deacetylase [Myxococcota bacterium]
MADVEALGKFLRPAQRILVFTGAGISTGSGIPDFRGPNGLWKKMQPVYFDEFLASEEKRVEHWEYKLAGYDAFASAKPNATHEAIAELERMGRLQAVVTQNIDGLHQDGGSSPDKIIEVHGTNRQIECLSCNERSDPAPAMAYFREHRRTPTCHCGGLMKAATISFGQSLEPGILERAAREAEEADLVVALGSTLSVHPAASIPLVAARNGTPYVIINRGATDQDQLADLKLDGDVTEILPPAVAALGATT